MEEGDMGFPDVTAQSDPPKDMLLGFKPDRKRHKLFPATFSNLEGS